MPIVTVHVEGAPVAQPRPRVRVAGRRPHAYVPASHGVHAWRKLCASRVRQVAPVRGWPIPKPEAVSVALTFTRESPKRKRPHWTVKPDLDNMVKSVLDALNGVVYEDDSQVVKCTSVKRYGTDVGVLIVIRWGGSHDYGREP